MQHIRLSSLSLHVDPSGEKAWVPDVYLGLRALRATPGKGGQDTGGTGQTTLRAAPVKA